MDLGWLVGCWLVCLLDIAIEHGALADDAGS